MLLARKLICSAALLALSSGLAAAAPATLERSAKVHSGPGIKYQVIATLRRGTVIDVSGCSGAWCEVAWRGRRGYVAHTVLAAGAVPGVAGVAPSQAYYADDYPGFDYPGYAYEPGIAIAPRPYRRSGRWPGWHHRPGGTGWAGRPGQLPANVAPGMKNAERVPRAGSFAPGPDPSGGGLRGIRSTPGPGAPAANSMTGSIGTGSAPIVSAPAVSAPAASAPVVSAPSTQAATPPSANAPAPR